MTISQAQNLQDASILGMLCIQAAYAPGVPKGFDKVLRVVTGEEWTVFKTGEDSKIPAAVWAFAGERYGIVGFTGLDNNQITAYLLGLRPSALLAADFVAHPAAAEGIGRSDVASAIARLVRCSRSLLCGHSYGGVVCDAIDATSPGSSSGNQRRMITFGSPRAVPPGVTKVRHWQDRFHWINHLDAIPSFPPQGSENLSVSLLVAQLIGEWPYDCRHVGQCWLADVDSTITSFQEVTPLATLAGLDVSTWILTGGGVTAFEHQFSQYQLRIVNAVGETPKIWEQPSKLDVPVLDSPLSFSNGLLTFRRENGFPATDFMRCEQ